MQYSQFQKLNVVTLGISLYNSQLPMQTKLHTLEVRLQKQRQGAVHIRLLIRFRYLSNNRSDEKG